MRPIKHILFIMLTLTTITGCIESYYPKEIFEEDYSFVVSGQVTNEPGFHTIRVSKSSSIAKPRFSPIKNCNVSIIDSDNNVFSSNSTGTNGEYQVWIDEEFLNTGKAFKVVIVTPNNIVIESAFDTLKLCPDIEDLYYHRVDNPTSNPSIFDKGIQFQIDLIADNSNDRFFRWELEETSEVRAQYPITYYYDGVINVVDPDYSLFYCWRTDPIKNIYTLSTKGLLENRFSGFNLHFVDNHSQKLMFLYSVKVNQYAITEMFFNYLEQLRINSSEQGGMFEAQPIKIIGNLRSTSHPDLRVLGFFGAASTKSKRFFFRNIENLDFEIPDFCTPSPLFMGFEPFSPDEYPVYLVMVGGRLLWANKVCFDCTEGGGTTEKPLFWP